MFYKIAAGEYVTTKNRQFYYKKAYLENSNIFLYGSYGMPLGHIIALCFRKILTRYGVENIINPKCVAAENKKPILLDYTKHDIINI